MFLGLYSAFLSHTTVTKKTIVNTLQRNGLKSCSAPRPPAEEGTCTVQARLKLTSEHLNDSEKTWEKVMWSHEITIELYGVNLARRVLDGEEC